MDITKFLRQTATLERRTGEDMWGTPSFEPPETIPARITQKVKLGKESRDEYHINVTEVMTNVEIRIRDRVDGEEILAVDTIVDFDGTIIAWKAYPKPPLGFA